MELNGMFHDVLLYHIYRKHTHSGLVTIHLSDTCLQRWQLSAIWCFGKTEEVTLYQINASML